MKVERILLVGNKWRLNASKILFLLESKASLLRAHTTHSLDLQSYSFVNHASRVAGRNVIDIRSVIMLLQRLEASCGYHLFLLTLLLEILFPVAVDYSHELPRQQKAQLVPLERYIDLGRYSHPNSTSPSILNNNTPASSSSFWTDREVELFSSPWGTRTEKHQ